MLGLQHKSPRWNLERRRLGLGDEVHCVGAVVCESLPFSDDLAYHGVVKQAGMCWVQDVISKTSPDFVCWTSPCQQQNPQQLTLSLDPSATRPTDKFNPNPNPQAVSAASDVMTDESREHVIPTRLPSVSQKQFCGRGMRTNDTPR